MKNIKYETVKVIIGILFLLMAMAALNWSCMSAKKATDFLNDNPKEAAEYCATKYPVRVDSIFMEGEVILDTVITEGETLVYVDTVYVNQYKTEYRTITKQCPPSMSITSFKTDTVIKTIENTASLEACEYRFNDTYKEKVKWEQKAKRRLNIIFILIAALVGFWAVKRFTPL